MLLYEHAYLVSGGCSTRHTHSDNDPALVPCAVLLLLPLLLHTPASASAVLLLFLMLPMLRVQHQQSYGYCTYFFFFFKALLGVRHVIWQALLGCVIYEYIQLSYFAPLRNGFYSFRAQTASPC